MKQSRIAAEGIARVAVNGNVAVVAEVNSETDFVAKMNIPGVCSDSCRYSTCF